MRFEHAAVARGEACHPRYVCSEGLARNSSTKEDLTLIHHDKLPNLDNKCKGCRIELWAVFDDEQCGHCRRCCFDHNQHGATKTDFETLTLEDINFPHEVVRRPSASRIKTLDKREHWKKPAKHSKEAVENNRCVGRSL